MRFLKLTKLYKNKPTKKPTKHLRRIIKIQAARRRWVSGGYLPTAHEASSTHSAIKKIKLKIKTKSTDCQAIVYWSGFPGAGALPRKCFQQGVPSVKFGTTYYTSWIQMNGLKSWRSPSVRCWHMIKLLLLAPLQTEPCCWQLRAAHGSDPGDTGRSRNTPNCFLTNSLTNNWLREGCRWFSNLKSRLWSSGHRAMLD